MNEELPPIGENLKRERNNRHLSLGELEKSSGISKAMLSQIESGKVNPTLVTIWKVAQALAMDVGELISGEKKRQDCFFPLTMEQQASIPASDGAVEFKLLTAPVLPEGVEMYHMIMAPHSLHVSEPHGDGCREYVMVIKGSVKITNGEHSIVLNQGDFLAYDGNLPHSMENVGGKVAELHMTDLVF